MSLLFSEVSESTPDDSKVLQVHLNNLEEENSQLKRELDRKTKSCERLIQDKNLLLDAILNVKANSK